MTSRTARFALLLVLAVCASSMAYFFGSANPRVALAALTAYACFLVAIFTVRKP